MKKTLEYYLKLPYSYIIEWSDTDNCYLGSIVEIEKHMTCGDTPQEVMANLKDALEAYIKTSLDNDFEIPEPIKASKFKGVITYRTTKNKHYDIAKVSKLLGVSINSFIDEAIEEKLYKRTFQIS